MKEFYYNDCMSLAYNVANKLENIDSDFPVVSVVAKYKEAQEIVSSLACLGYNLSCINLITSEMSGYLDEYVISVDTEGIWCEPMKQENGYIVCESDYTYISNSANSACLKYVVGYKVAFEIVDDELYNEDDELFEDLCCGLEEDDCYDCCDCDLCENDSDYTKNIENYVYRNDDNEACGFKHSVSENSDGCYSYFGYSYFDTCSETVKKVARTFDIKL